MGGPLQEGALQVKAKEALPAGSPEEVEIRACTIVAVERLKAALASAAPQGMSIGSSPSCSCRASSACQAGGVGADLRSVCRRTDAHLRP